MIVAFFWIFLMQWLTRYMVWLSILAIFIVTALGLYYSFSEFRRLSNAVDNPIDGANRTTLSLNLPSNESPKSLKYIRAETNSLQFSLDVNGILKDELESYRNNKTTWMVLSIILAVFLLIITLLLFCLFRRISLAIAVIEEASK